MGPSAGPLCFGEYTKPIGAIGKGATAVCGEGSMATVILRSEARVALCRMQKIDLASWVGNPNYLVIN